VQIELHGFLAFQADPLPVLGRGEHLVVVDVSVESEEGCSRFGLDHGVLRAGSREPPDRLHRVPEGENLILHFGADRTPQQIESPKTGQSLELRPNAFEQVPRVCIGGVEVGVASPGTNDHPCLRFVARRATRIRGAPA
jgi:hypothetical protein